MSRIHDALRRGRLPAQPPPGGRTAHADAVLAALGYQSAQPRRPHSGILLGVVLFIAAAVGVWWFLPVTVAPKPTPVGPQAPAQAGSKPPQAPQAPAQTAAPQIKPAEPKPVVEAKPAPEPPPEPTPSVGTKPITRPAPRASVKMPPAIARGAIPPKPSSPAESAIPAEADDFKLALYYQRTGDFEQALVHYKAVLQRDEMNADAHNNVGNLYMSKALYEDAAREFHRVVAIEPKYVTAHVNLSAALFQLKRYDEAAAEARAAIRLDGRSSDAYVNLALAQAAAGQASDARSSLTRALELDKHNAAAHYNLAQQYEKSGELALALDHYRAFLQYAGPEQAAYAADVRSRVQALERK